MRRRSFLSLAALALPCFSQEAAKLPSGESILDRYIEVTGGRAAYEKITSDLTTGRMEMPAQGIKASLKSMRAKPGSRSIVEIEGVGKMEEGSTGGVAWEKSVMTGARIKSGAEQAIALRTAALDREHNWRNYYTAAENQGVESIQGEDCYKILLTAKAGKPETRYYSKASGLLVRMTMTMPNPMGEIPTETTVSDYRDVSGIKMPFKTEMSVMGQKMNLTFESVKLNVEIPAEEFAMPADIAALAAKPAENKSPR